LNRRAFVVGLAAALAAPRAAGAQQAKIPRIGVLSLDSPANSGCVDALRRDLNDLGYVEGRTYVLELRWAEDRIEVLPALAGDLVRAKVDLIVSASGPAAVLWKEATTSIPVVLASSFYPVESGVVASLAHPGGNVTGVTHFTPELIAKRVQLLKEITQKALRFAALRLPRRLQDLVVRDIDGAARKLGVQLQVIEVRGVEDLSAAFDSAVAGRAQAIMSTQGHSSSITTSGSRSWRSGYRVNRRAFVTGLGVVLAAPLAAEAQPIGKVYRLGMLPAGPRRSIKEPRSRACRDLARRRHSFVDERRRLSNMRRYAADHRVDHAE